MNQVTQKLSFIAYYLSKYDIDGVKKLGYATRQRAFDEISSLFGYNNSYLKMRRDEFDVVTGSHRKGFKNRKPAESVSKLTAFLDEYTFEEMTDMIKKMISSQQRANGDIAVGEDYTELNGMDSSVVEDLLNSHDSTARLEKKVTECYQRVYSVQSIERLKRHYQYRCQICGTMVGKEFGVPIAEVHHIIPFSESYDNSLTNLIVLCPNHHRILHKIQATFDSERNGFVLQGNVLLPLKINDHL